MSQSLVHRTTLSDRTVAAGREVLAGRRRGVLAFLPFAGPAVIASIAYMDPGNFATNIQGGAQFGYLLLWVVVLANAVAMLFQALSAKLGIVTGQSLAQLCRTHFPRPLVYAMWIASEVAAMATDLAESLGAAIGLSLLFGLPLLTGLVITFTATYVMLLMQGRGFRPIEMLIAAFIGVIAVCYLIELFVAPPELGCLRVPCRGAEARRTGQRHAGGRHHRRNGDATCDLPAFQPDAEPHARAQRYRTPHHHRLFQPRGADRTRHCRPGEHGDAGDGRLGVPRRPRRRGAASRPPITPWSHYSASAPRRCS